MSQCTTAAQCLKELARVMEQFGIDDTSQTVNSKYVRHIHFPAKYNNGSLFCDPYYWSFAVAEVEGKPVFIGDELYPPFCTSPFIAAKVGDDGYISCGHYQYEIRKLSWNPPKPRTIMVELLVKDAEYTAGTRCVLRSEVDNINERNSKACAKALEELK